MVYVKCWLTEITTLNKENIILCYLMKDREDRRKVLLPAHCPWGIISLRNVETDHIGSMTSLNEHKTLIAAASSKLALTIATKNQSICNLFHRTLEIWSINIPS